MGGYGGHGMIPPVPGGVKDAGTGAPGYRESAITSR
jgi:hypothetical protein